jgi:hypothetical protein
LDSDSLEVARGLLAAIDVIPVVRLRKVRRQADLAGQLVTVSVDDYGKETIVEVELNARRDGSLSRLDESVAFTALAELVPGASFEPAAPIPLVAVRSVLKSAEASGMGLPQTL